MNIEKLMGDLSSNMKVKGAELNKIMAGSTSPQDAVSKLTSAFPGDTKGMLDAFNKVPSGSFEGGFAKLQEVSADSLSALTDKFSGQLQEGLPKVQQLMSAENIKGLTNKATELLKSPELQEKLTQGIEKIKNFDGLEDIQNKLTSSFKEIQAPDFQSGFDRLNELFAEDGLDIPVDDLATKMQLGIDEFNKNGGFQQIGDLSKEQLDGLTTQMAKFNTNFDPGRYATDFDGALGKFKMDPGMLQEAGMLQKGLGDKFQAGLLSASDIVNNPANWKGGTLPGSKSAFLGNPKAQETGFKAGLSGYYNKMKANGAIRPGDTAKMQGAMMAVSTKMGPAAAKAWREASPQVSGALQSLGNTLAQHGAYGVDVLGARR